MAELAAIDVQVSPSSVLSVVTVEVLDTKTQTIDVDSDGTAYDVAVVTVGIQGPPGVGSAFIFTQATPLAVWTIDHNFGNYPNVFVLDTNGDECEGDIGNPTINRTVITFSAPFAGTARLT